MPFAGSKVKYNLIIFVKYLLKKTLNRNNFILFKHPFFEIMHIDYQKKTTW